MNTTNEIHEIDTDLLIIGGGLAGCMAAIKAREYDVSVTLVEKADTRASGCAGTGVDHMWAYIPPVHEEMGYGIEDLVESHTKGIAHGFIDSGLLHFIARESYNRMLDLEKFGLNFRYEDSKLPGKFRVVTQFHSVPSTFNFDGRDVKIHLTREARKRGVNILNRVTMVELLSTPEGHVSGGLGVGTRDGKIYAFRAKAVVSATGRVNRVSRSQTGVWGNTRLPAYETGDGRAMAFRAGLPIINMEFLSPSMFAIGNFELNLGAPRNTTQPAGSVVDGDGHVLVPRTHFYDWTKLGQEKVGASEVLSRMLATRPKERPEYWRMHHEGEGPFFLDLTGGTEDEIRYIEWSISNEGKGAYFLDYLKKQEKFDFRKDKLEYLPNSREMAGTASSGLVVDGNLETEIKGFFAAGDEVGGLPWVCAPGAFTMGWHAGEMAAKEAASQKSFFERDRGKQEVFKERCGSMIANKDGLHWREVEMAIQNIVDHYAGNERTAKILARGMERLQGIRNTVSFRAENAHELGRSLEVISVLDNAEMILRASMERKESRRIPFGFYRPDFPEKNDEDYFAFLGQRLRGETVEFHKITIK